RRLDERFEGCDEARRWGGRRGWRRAGWTGRRQRLQRAADGERGPAAGAVGKVVPGLGDIQVAGGEVLWHRARDQLADDLLEVGEDAGLEAPVVVDGQIEIGGRLRRERRLRDVAADWQAEPCQAAVLERRH